MDETMQLEIPRRRRSSILPRRSIVPPSTNVQSSVDTTCVPTESTFKIQPTITLDNATDEISKLKCSINESTIELDKWKNLRLERKLLKNVEKRETPLQLSWETAHEFLSEDDVRLLKDTPPYEKIRENYDRLVCKAALLRNKYDRCSNLVSGINLLVKSRSDTIIKDIGEYSENNADVYS